VSTLTAQGGPAVRERTRPADPPAPPVHRLAGHLSDAELRSWTPEQRAALARRLAAFGGVGPGLDALDSRQRPSRRTVVIVATALLSLGLLGWTSQLAARLPSRYLTGHWDVAWVGFDLMLAVGIAATGLSIWRGSRLAPGLALATAAMLVCDAWFDVSTAAGTTDLVTSMLLAAFVELPLAALGVALAYRTTGDAEPRPAPVPARTG